MAGRRPKPLAIHQLNGNPSHLSQADLSGMKNPQPELVNPEMPKGMSKSARREWRRIVPLLREVGVLSKIDGLALAAYCDAHGMVEEAEKLIRKGGMTFVSHFEDGEGNIVDGDIKANPAVAIKFQALKVMKSFLIEFGLTPASRSKLKIDKPAADDKMEAFLRKRPAQVTPFVVKPEQVM